MAWRRPSRGRLWQRKQSYQYVAEQLLAKRPDKLTPAIPVSSEVVRKLPQSCRACAPGAELRPQIRISGRLGPSGAKFGPLKPKIDHLRRLTGVVFFGWTPTFCDGRGQAPPSSPGENRQTRQDNDDRESAKTQAGQTCADSEPLQCRPLDERQSIWARFGGQLCWAPSKGGRGVGGERPSIRSKGRSEFRSETGSPSPRIWTPINQLPPARPESGKHMAGVMHNSFEIAQLSSTSEPVRLK